MSWAKIDDRANEHRKQLEAGAEACWLWACGLMYANRQAARDGFIPEQMIGMLYPFPKPGDLARRLVKAGLWRKTQGGFKIHEFEVWNRTREEIEEERRKGRERAAKSYAKNGPKKKKSSPEEIPKTEAKTDPKDHVSSGSPSAPLPLPFPTASSGSERRQPCPKELRLEPDQRATLETYPIPGWAIDAMTVTYVAKYVGNLRELRTLDEWRRGLVTTITADWNNSSKRPKQPAANDGQPVMALPKGVKFGTEGL